MLSQDALEAVLAIGTRTATSAEEMARQLNVTFYPRKHEHKISVDVQSFIDRLTEVLTELRVNIVPFEDALHTVSVPKMLARLLSLLYNDLLYVLEYPVKRGDGRFFVGPLVMIRILHRTKIKSGISVIMTGEYDDGELPIDRVSSFRKSSVIAVTDMPETITASTDFTTHFNTAMSYFAHHMANIVILVKGQEWVLYNFNASHPQYHLSNLRTDILHGLIPKLVAPIRPLRFQDMKYISPGFDAGDAMHRPIVDDLVRNSRLLEGTGLYPPGKRIDDLPFRSSFYRWIGAIHLDHRSGMSYGFLARQMPTVLSELIPFADAETRLGRAMPRDADHFRIDGSLYITLELSDGGYCMKVPEVWVLGQRSGANKTSMDPSRDLVKLGLKDGRIYIQAPSGLYLRNDYRPSFDTGVILAHAVGNAIVASILRHIDPNDAFAAQISTGGAALVHWHGYVDPAKVPDGWLVHGIRNPNVSCSSPQASIYAIRGKLDAVMNNLRDHKQFRGDIHIEPHHGTNMSHESIAAIAQLFLGNPDMVRLGNEYLQAYSLTADA